MPKTWDDAAAHWLGVYNNTVVDRTSVWRDRWDVEKAEELRSVLAAYVLGFRDADTITMIAYDALAALAVEALDREKLWNWQDMLDLLVSKQRDYGCRNIDLYGHIGIVVRLSDKLARIENLLRQKLPPQNESLVDSYRDVVGYCVIARMFEEGTFHLELDKEALVS